MNFSDLLAILPLVILVGWAIILILVDLLIPSHRKGMIAPFAVIGIIIALGVAISQFGEQSTAFGGMVAVDGFSVFLQVLFLISGLFGIALAYDYLKRQGIEHSEYYILLLFSLSGMMLMAMAADLIMVFLALELLSIPLYVLAGFASPRLDSEEAALKYFLLGAFAGGFVVYGIALVFGATQTTALQGIIAATKDGSANVVLLVIGAALILIGLGFKVAVVPFHMWTPDVYQGAPSSVTAFMAVGAKAAGFAGLLRVFMSAFNILAVDLIPILWTLSVITMLLGNIVAIAQSNIKRLLAYSSIAHAGYILMGMVTLGQGEIEGAAIAAALFYLVAYVITSFGAWAVVIALEHGEGKGLALDDYAGLGGKHPALAAAMTVFMLSFTGVPPTLGFMGKFFLFSAVLDGGYVGLAVIGVLTSLVSAYYYLRVVVVMYMQEGEPRVRRDIWLNTTTAITAIATVAISVFSTPLFNWAVRGVMVFFK
ncbi:MAG: NADH-quinone oxidoreductase subunit N [Anaerolineales bacterium]|nr:NADH-quinone oxidoreductase subunit N [Anaerolineales bacterium]